MKKLIFIFLIFCGIKSYSQEDYTIKSNYEEYNELMNYIPKSIVFDTIYDSDNLLFKKILKEQPKNIVLISSEIQFLKNQLILSKNENNILIKMIKNLVTGLFLDDKKVIIS